MRATMARNLANRYGSVLLFSPRLGRLGRVATSDLGDRFRPFTRYRFAFALAFARFVLCAFARLFLPTGGVGVCVQQAPSPAVVPG